jgi:hypothetical protein
MIEDKREYAAFAAAALNGNIAAVLPGDPLGNGQPQTGTACLGGKKRIKYIVDYFLRNPRTIVLDRQAGPVFLVPGPYRNRTMVINCLISIQQKVDDDLLYLVWIAIHRPQVRGQVLL